MSKSMNADDFWWSNHGEYFIILSSSDNPFTGVQVGMHLRKGNLYCFLGRRGYQTRLCFLSDNRYGFRNQVLKCSPAVNSWMTEAMTLTSNFQFIPGLKESCHTSNHGNSMLYLSCWILASSKHWRLKPWIISFIYEMNKCSH